MSNIIPIKAPKTDPEVERLRREAEARATEQEQRAAALASERRRSIALGFRGRSSLINAGTSAGFADQTTIGA